MNKDDPVVVMRVANGFKVFPYQPNGVVGSCSEEYVFQEMGGICDRCLLGFLAFHFTAHKTESVSCSEELRKMMEGQP